MSFLPQMYSAIGPASNGWRPLLQSYFPCHHRPKEEHMKPALYLALLPLIIFSPAGAQEYEHGTAVLCDTQRQVERYVELVNGKEQSAIDAVNAEAQNPTACVFETVAFV